MRLRFIHFRCIIRLFTGTTQFYACEVRFILYPSHALSVCSHVPLVPFHTLEICQLLHSQRASVLVSQMAP